MCFYYCFVYIFASFLCVPLFALCMGFCFELNASNRFSPKALTRIYLHKFPLHCTLTQNHMAPQAAFQRVGCGEEGRRQPHRGVV